MLQVHHPCQVVSTSFDNIIAIVIPSDIHAEKKIVVHKECLLLEYDNNAPAALNDT